MNTPTDIRNDQHAAKRASHAERRAQVLAALAECARPVSTRTLALAMGLDVLCVRPRVTELYQAGLVVLDGKDTDGGLYRVATVAETLAYERSHRPDGGEIQSELPFTTRRHAYR